MGTYTSVMFKIIDPPGWNRQRAKTIKKDIIIPTDYSKQEFTKVYGNR